MAGNKKAQGEQGDQGVKASSIWRRVHSPSALCGYLILICIYYVKSTFVDQVAFNWLRSGMAATCYYVVMMLIQLKELPANLFRMMLTVLLVCLSFAIHQ